jgi:hypothetical protein
MVVQGCDAGREIVTIATGEGTVAGEWRKDFSRYGVYSTKYHLEYERGNSIGDNSVEDQAMKRR